MWRDTIVRTISFDMLPLKRRGENFTLNTLESLRTRLVSATVYACGEEASVRSDLEQKDATRHTSLFDSEGVCLPLPQADMLLEYTASDGQQRAALLSDREEHGVDIFVFRFNAQRGRWMWPFLGMHYGPTFHENSRIAVYDPERLTKTGSRPQAAMIQEHSRDAGIAICCLELVRQGKRDPEGTPGKSAAERRAAKAGRVASPTPPSMARASRTHHEQGSPRKGARRS